MNIKKMLETFKSKVNLKVLMVVVGVVLAIIAISIILELISGPDRMAKKVVASMSKKETISLHALKPAQRETAKLIASKTKVKLLPGTKSEVTDKDKLDKYKAKKMFRYNVEISTIDTASFREKIEEEKLDDKNVKDQLKAVKRAFNKVKSTVKKTTSEITVYQVEGDSEWSYMISDSEISKLLGQ